MVIQMTLGSYLHDDLDRIEHISSVESFYHKFEVIRALVAESYPELPEDYFATRFLYGLQQDYQGFVLRFHPVTALASIYEDSFYLDYFPENEVENNFLSSDESPFVDDDDDNAGLLSTEVLVTTEEEHNDTVPSSVDMEDEVVTVADWSSDSPISLHSVARVTSPNEQLISLCGYTQEVHVVPELELLVGNVAVILPLQNKVSTHGVFISESLLLPGYFHIVFDPGENVVNRCLPLFIINNIFYWDCFISASGKSQKRVTLLAESPKQILADVSDTLSDLSVHIKIFACLFSYLYQTASICFYNSARNVLTKFLWLLLYSLDPEVCKSARTFRHYTVSVDFFTGASYFYGTIKICGIGENMPCIQAEAVVWTCSSTIVKQYENTFLSSATERVSAQGNPIYNVYGIRFHATQSSILVYAYSIFRILWLIAWRDRSLLMDCRQGFLSRI